MDCNFRLHLVEMDWHAESVTPISPSTPPGIPPPPTTANHSPASDCGSSLSNRNPGRYPLSHAARCQARCGAPTSALATLRTRRARCEPPCRRAVSPTVRCIGLTHLRPPPSAQPERASPPGASAIRGLHVGVVAEVGLELGDSGAAMIGAQALRGRDGRGKGAEGERTVSKCTEACAPPGSSMLQRTLPAVNCSRRSATQTGGPLPLSLVRP